MSEFDGDSRSTDPELLGLCVEYTRPTMNDGKLGYYKRVILF